MAQVQFKLFDIYDVSNIVITDDALKPFMNFAPKLLVKSYGKRNDTKLSKLNVNLIERLANRLQVPGHSGRKHKVITSWASGKYNRNMKTVMQALEIIGKKTGKNPIQVYADAINNGSPRDEITVIEQAGARYPQAVDCSPIRRINLAIRWMVLGAYAKAFGKKKKMHETLAEEIIKASDNNMESYACGKRNETEKQADSAR
ncbi:MAG: 30S ribosomal protein S7 [Nanoarchaeota archaeon]